MKLIDLQKRLNLKEQLKGMSYENLVKLAKEDPLIPVEETKAALADNVGHSAAVQNYCTLVNSQPDMQLAEVPNIIPSQNRARSNAVYWESTLSQRVRAVYTQVEAFANDYGSLDESDIDDLLADINEPGGKDTFLQVMYWFRDSASHAQQETSKLSTDLITFSDNLNADLRDFQLIKLEVDALYSGHNSIILVLQAELEALESKIKGLNVSIGIRAAIIAGAVMVIAIGAFIIIAQPPPFPAALTMIGGGLAVATGTAIELNLLIQERKDTQQNCRGVLEELKLAQYRCAALQELSRNFGSLIDSNQLASLALGEMMIAWQTINVHLSHIAELVQGVVDEAVIELIRLRLTNALAEVRELKAFAEECRRNSIIDVVSDEEIGRILRLPHSWVGRAVNGEVFNEFITSSRGLGRYDKGRRGWASRDRHFICRLHR